MNEEVEVNKVILDVVGAIAERGTLQTVTFKLIANINPLAVRGQNIRSRFTYFCMFVHHDLHNLFA